MFLQITVFKKRTNRCRIVFLTNKVHKKRQNSISLHADGRNLKILMYSSVNTNAKSVFKKWKENKYFFK